MRPCRAVDVPLLGLVSVASPVSPSRGGSAKTLKVALVVVVAIGVAIEAAVGVGVVDAIVVAIGGTSIVVAVVVGASVVVG